jgi:hypothetical protein
MKQKLPEEIMKIIFKINIFIKKINRKHPYKIRHIYNPSETIQKLAVTNYGNSIEYIQKPSESIQKLAVTQNGWD